MKKGRDKELIKKRNAALLKRYVYWAEVQRLRFDDILTILSEQEFFISEERILRIIREAKHLPDCTEVAMPKAKTPRLTFQQLNLFSNDPDFAVAQLNRESRICK